MKILVSLYVLLLLIFATPVFAQAINSEFKPSAKMSEIKEGDLVEINLRFWPIENADLTQFKKLEKTVFFNAFYLAQILSLETSANNADVIELKGLFIVKSAKPQSMFIIKYNETPIEMRVEGLKIQELKEKSQNYIILNQSVNQSYVVIIIIAVLVLILIVLIIKRNSVKEFFGKLKPDDTKKAKKRFDDLFRMANKREDFELIYKEKNLWLKLLETRAPAHDEFFKTLNQYQFKKEWNNEDYSIVLASFDIIRRSFEK